MDIQRSCLIFPFSRTNANAISALLAAIDIHDKLTDLKVFLPSLKNNAADISDKITQFDNIILAFSVYSTQLDLIKNKISEYREIIDGKNLIVIAGGPHPQGSPRSMLMNGPDVVCTGEGEIVITQLIELVIKCYNSKIRCDFSTIKGVAYLENGRMIKTGKSDFVDLNKFPPFSIKHSLYRPIEITRGCAWNCRFCQTRKKKVKHRSIEMILEYVKKTVDHFSERRPDIRFISPNALSYGSSDGRDIDLKIVENLLYKIRQIIGEDGKIYFGSFPSEIRPETVTEESVNLLKKYTNVSKLIIGGQSGSNKVREIAERGHSKEETERAAKLLLNAGFKVDVDIIFGLPGEDDEDINLTIEHIEVLTNMGATIHSHTFMPLVGTPFANKEPGSVSKQYVKLISNLQQEQKLSGSHSRQAIDAKIMAERRKKENMYI